MLKTHFVLGARPLAAWVDQSAEWVLELTQQRCEIKCPQRAYSCFRTPLSTETLYPRILLFLKDRFKACVSNAFGEIF